MSFATKIDRIMTNFEGLLPIILLDTLVTFSCDITLKTKINICTTSMFMANKLGRVGVFNEELPSKKLQGSLITWFWKVTWNIRSFVPLLSQGLGAPNLTKWLLTMRAFHLQSHTTNWQFNHMRSQWWTSFHKATITLDQLVLRGHMTN